MSGVLIDTDVLIRAYTAAGVDPRADKAKEVLESLARAGTGFVSSQTLDEFSAAALDFAEPPVPVARVRETLDRLSGVFGVLHPSPHTLERALHAVDRHRLPFWDSLLWAVAHEHGLSEVLTEHPPATPLIEGIAYRAL
jgi:predicted nucleic acid-binding protein